MDFFITDRAIDSIMESWGFKFECSDHNDNPEGNMRQYWNRLDETSLKLCFFAIRKADRTEIYSVGKDDFVTLTCPDGGFQLKSSKGTRFAFIPMYAIEDLIDFLS